MQAETDTLDRRSAWLLYGFFRGPGRRRATRKAVSPIYFDGNVGDLPIAAQFEGRREIWSLESTIRLVPHAYISFNANPPPTSSVSLFVKIPLKSAASPTILGASPLFGALGLANFLLFS